MSFTLIYDQNIDRCCLICLPSNKHGANIASRQSDADPPLRPQTSLAGTRSARCLSRAIKKRHGDLRSNVFIIQNDSGILRYLAGTVQSLAGIVQYTVGILRSFAGALRSLTVILQSLSGILRSHSGTFQCNSGKCIFTKQCPGKPSQRRGTLSQLLPGFLY